MRNRREFLKGAVWMGAAAGAITPRLALSTPAWTG